MILDLYLARRFLGTFGGTLAVFFAILGLIDLIEHVTRYADDVDGIGQIVGLMLLNAPSELYDILPLVTMIAAVTLFLGLARTSELAVVRGAGRSALRALVGPALAAALIGAGASAVLNPLLSAMAREYDLRVADIEGDGRALAFSEEGLWLRQAGESGPAVIRAAGSDAQGTRLSGVTIFRYGPEGRPLERIEARRARLEGGAWIIEEAKVWPLLAANPEAEAVSRDRMTVPSSLTPDQIRDGFGDPSSVPIWALPRFIAQLEQAGFAAERHRVFLQTELAQPVFLLAMLLVAAGFTLRHQRGRRTGVMVLGAILTGFAAYVLRDLALILGEAGQVPPALAVWAPTLATVGLSLGLLLHLEEG